MMIARTVSRSLTATRAERSSYGDAQAEAIESVRGVAFAGLGCPLDEWDAVVATMPESIRPSVRGAHSAAFERAYIAWRHAHPTPTAPAPDDPTSQTEPRPLSMVPRPRSLSERILDALADEPRTAAALAALMPDAPAPAVHTALYRLMATGVVTRNAARTREGFSYSRAAQGSVDPVPAAKRPRNVRRTGLVDEILLALLDRPRTVMELSAVLDTSNDYSVRRAVHRLLDEGRIRHDNRDLLLQSAGPRRLARYALAAHTERALRATSAHRGIAS